MLEASVLLQLAPLCATYLVLNEKLDTLNGSGSGLRDGGGDTTHCRYGQRCDSVPLRRVF